MQKAKQFLTKSLAIRLLPLVVIGWFAQSCNNSVVVEDNPPPSAPAKLIDSLPIYSLGGDALLPDAATWKIGKDTGDAKLVVVEKRKNDTAIIAVRIPHKSFSDTLKIQYWKYGILVQTRLYLADGPDDNDLPDLVSRLTSSTNTILLAALADAHKSADSAQYPLNRTGFIAAYANLVLTGNSKTSFPDDLPAGISKDSIQNLVIVNGAKKGMTAADLVSKTKISLTLPELTARITILIEARILPAELKDKLLPPSTISWVDPFAVENATVKQRGSLGLKGKVSSGSKWVVRSIDVFNKEKLNVTSQFAITQPKDSTTLEFQGVVKLIPSADLGNYTVRFFGKNEKGDTTSVTAGFEVVKSDDPDVVLPPQITRLQPAGLDSTLGFGTETVVVKWKVKDHTGYKILTALINGREAELGKDSTYSVEIKLNPGQDSVARLKVTSSSSETSLDTVVLHRAKDNLKPQIRKLGWGYVDTTINSQGAYEFGKSEVTVNLKWEIEDNYKLHPDSAACIVSVGKIVRCLEVKIPDPAKPLVGVVSFDYAVPNLYSNITLQVKDAAGLVEEYKVNFVRPQKEGDILAVWDSFNWDAPKVVWQ